MRNRNRPEKTGFVSIEHGYHGETLGALAVTDIALFHDVYAPLLKIRHATTDPRFLIMARDGALPAAARAVAENYLRSHPASAH